MKGDISFSSNNNKFEIWALKAFSICMSIFLLLATVFVYGNIGSFQSAVFVMLSGLFLSTVSIFLVFNEKYTSAKFILIAVPTYSFAIASILSQYEGFNFNLLSYLVPKLFAMLYLMIPIVFFGLRNKKQMLLSFLILLPLIFCYDFLNESLGIYVYQLEVDFDYYNYFVGMSSFFYFFVLLFVLFLEKLNKRYKSKIFSQKQEMENEFLVTKKLNSELEYQSNLYQILNITSKNKQLIFLLQEVLEKVLIISSLANEQKGLISLTNKNGSLDIAAHKNIDKLLNTSSVIPKGHCVCGKVLNSKTNLFCNGIKDNHVTTLEDVASKGHYVIPIIHRGRVLGMLNVYTKEGAKKDLEIERFLESVANVLAKKITADNVEEKLIVKNIELDFNRKQIEKTNLELKQTYKELDESINYAEYMQKSLIPNKTTLDSFFEQSDVFFSPKDRVSGDFYFAHDLGDYLYFGVADCTGHGIPGSFLAAMSTEAIKSVINSNIAEKPNLILEILREVAKERFSVNQGDKRADSMDASLCMYDRKKDLLYFSGGFSDMIIVRNGNELIELKGTRCPVGYYPIEPKFDLHQIKLQSGDAIYLYTDGFVDQFGDLNGKEKPGKFKKKRFREMLLELSSLNCKSQVEKLEKTLKEWRGDMEQVDDVTVFIAKYS